MIYFAGLNIDAKRASFLVENDTLIRVAEGVYVDANEPDIAQITHDHAARIVSRNYPDANLSHSSAYFRGAVGKSIYIGGNYRKTRSLDYLDVIQDVSPTGGELTHQWITLEDSLGRFRIMAATDEMIFLQMFERTKKFNGKVLPAATLRKLSESLLKKHGGEDKLMRVLDYIAGRESMTDAFSRASVYVIKTQQEKKGAQRPNNLHQFGVYWNRRHVADLTHNGMEWEFGYRDGWILPLSASERSRGRRLPPFIAALLPEGWGANVNGAKTESDILESGVRYLSNLCVTNNPDTLKQVPKDSLIGRLQNNVKNGVFNGKQKGVPTFDEEFESNLARIWNSKMAPKISGVQIKIPMTLDVKGNLFPAVDTPFTHILKISGTGGYEALGGLEWFCLELTRGAGVPVSDNALVFSDNGVPPSLLSERWDIQSNPRDKRTLISEDLCSALGFSPENKYDASLEDVANQVAKFSTDAESDLNILLRQTIASWLMGNGDMHMKNFCLLKSAAPMLDHFESVRLSPAYDMLSTRVLPMMANDSMALPMNGKNDNLTVDDFIQFGRKIGMNASQVQDIISNVAIGMTGAALRIVQKLPKEFDAYPVTKMAIMKTAQLVVQRGGDLIEEKPKKDWQPEYFAKPRR